MPLFSGQAPVLYVCSLVSFSFSPISIRFQMPQSIDIDTPKAAHTRKGFDGFDYEIVFSDEFNTPGRTFYPGLLTFFSSFLPLWFFFVVSSFSHDFAQWIISPTDHTQFLSPLTTVAATSISRVCGPIFLLLFLGRSWILCHPATCLPKMSGGILIAYFVQAQISHSFFPFGILRPNLFPWISSLILLSSWSYFIPWLHPPHHLHPFLSILRLGGVNYYSAVGLDT